LPIIHETIVNQLHCDPIVVRVNPRNGQKGRGDSMCKDNVEDNDSDEVPNVELFYRIHELNFEHFEIRSNQSKFN
jgi:hypothetical protein